MSIGRPRVAAIIMVDTIFECEEDTILP